MTRQKRSWLTSKRRSRPIWQEINRKFGIDCEPPVLTTRTPLLSSMRWLVTLKPFSSSRQPLNSSLGVRSRRIRSYSPPGCSSPTCLRHPFPSFHSHCSPLGTARLVSLIITAILLLLLDVGRGLVGHRNVALTALETLGIATAAALAGFLIGK